MENTTSPDRGDGMASRDFSVALPGLALLFPVNRWLAPPANFLDASGVRHTIRVSRLSRDFASGVPHTRFHARKPSVRSRAARIFVGRDEPALSKIKRVEPKTPTAPRSVALPGSF
jgi:hypothetical protein